MISATVVLATYNRARTLHAALESLTRQVVPAGFEWELLVVDNNSSDDTEAVVNSFMADGAGPIHYLFEPRQGKSFALNTAIAEARGEIVAFTDDDVVVDPHWLARMVDRMREYRCEAAGGRIDPVWTRPRPAWLEMEGRYRLGSVVVSMNCGDAPCWFADTDTLPLGANLAIRLDTLRRIGLFRTDLGPTTGSQIRGEDSDICRRLLAAGCRVLYVPDAVVHHPVDDRRLRREYFRQYYFDQGRAVTREEGFDPAVRWWGVPRHLFRRAGARFARWMLSFDGKRRFYHQLQFYYALGRITEARATSAQRRSPGGP